MKQLLSLAKGTVDPIFHRGGIVDKKTKFTWFVSAACVAVIACFIARHMYQVHIYNENVAAGLRLRDGSA